MAVMVVCGCGRQLQVDEGFIGRQMRCPNCGREFTAAAPPTYGPLPWYQPLGWAQPLGDFRMLPEFEPAPQAPAAMPPVQPPPTRSGYPRAAVPFGQVRTSARDVGRPDAVLGGMCLHCRRVLTFAPLAPVESGHRAAGLEVRRCPACTGLLNICVRCLTINMVAPNGPHAACVECGHPMG